MSYKYFDAAALRGKTIASIKKEGDDLLLFSTSDGVNYAMQHHQDCCEHVRIIDIDGDILSIIGSPLITAREETLSQENPVDAPADALDMASGNSFTWTIYYFETESAKIRIRWLGISNGYYSESVQIDQIN